MTDQEIIQLLGGVTAVARMLDIKPPSVHAWLEAGIPEGRLRDLAAQIEINSDGRFSRRQRWPDKFAFYWPELAQAPASTTPVAVNTAQGVAANTTPDATEAVPTPDIDDHRSHSLRRTHADSPYDHSDIDRRAEEGPTHFGRRASNGHPGDAERKGV